MGREQFTKLAQLTKMYEYPTLESITQASPVSDTYYEVFDDTTPGKLEYVWVYVDTDDSNPCILTLRITTDAGGAVTTNVSLNDLQGKFVYVDENGLVSTTTETPSAGYDAIEYTACKVEVKEAAPYTNAQSITVRTRRSDLR